VSIGMARLARGARVPLRQLYLLADKYMYAAKARGRGLVLETIVHPEAT
jgi:PleD family two-component response regulator